MAYLISWVLWLLYVLVATAAMYTFLSFFETTVSRMLGCRTYYVFDYERILARGDRCLYKPLDTPVVYKPIVLEGVTATTAEEPTPAPAVDKYEAYRRGVRQMLEARWPYLPDHVVSTAMDIPREEILSIAPTADGWASRIQKAASGWLAADTGLPSELVQHVTSARDLEDQLRLADLEIVLMDMATEYPAVKDLADLEVVSSVFQLLRSKGRPLMKAGDYIKAAAAYGAVETTAPSLKRAFAPGGMTAEQWMTLRYRARDF